MKATQGRVLLCLLLLSCSVSLAATPTNIDQDLESFLRDLTNSLSLSKHVRVTTFDQGKAALFTVELTPADEPFVLGPAGKTQTTIQDVINELSIARQRDQAAAQQTPFEISKRRVHYVRFVRAAP